MEKAVPTACIAREKGESYCGRSLDSKEFAFQDAAYAARVYSNSKVVKACPQCIEAWEDQPSFGTQPMSTQGLEKNRR